MPRIFIAVLALCTLSSACKIQRTPDEYFDHDDRLEASRAGSTDELRDRVLALGHAIARGNGTEAMVALAPAAELRIITPQQDVVLTGPEAIRATVDRFASTPIAISMRDVVVTVGPLGNVGWFEALVDAPGSGPDGTVLRVTGVYLRTEGAWEMVQAHISTPRPAQSRLPPRDSAEAPPEA